MNRGILIGLAAAAAVAVAVTAATVIRMNLAKRPAAVYDTGEGLAEFTWSQSGDSLGGHESYTLTRTGESEWSAVHIRQEAHNLPEKAQRRKTDASAAERITAIILEYGMTEWNDLPPAEMFAMDAPTTEVCFLYNGEEYSFTSGQKLPDGGWVAVAEILGVLAEAVG